MTQLISATDRRRLAVDISGATNGTPVFLLHGTPGSRNGPKPRGIVLYRLGVRLICYDRPGYGQSDRQIGRSVADAAGDVSDIADALGIDRFAVVGRSGGGPHALACAALLKDRVERAAALVSLAPPDAEELDWYGGMTDSNIVEYRRAEADPEAARADLMEKASHIRDDPEYLLRFLLPELAGPDRRVVDDVAIRRKLADTYAEALRQNANGWVDDVLALRRLPWGFALSEIKAPVLLWHGGADMFSPVSHTYWLADHIPDAETDIQPGAAHFGAVESLPRVLAWITGAGTPGGLRTAGGRPHAVGGGLP